MYDEPDRMQQIIVCHCSSRSTSLFVTGHVSTQFSGYLLPGIFLPLMSIIGNMEWNLMMSATESNIWGEKIYSEYDAGEIACWTRFLNVSTHIIWPLSCSQGVLAAALHEPNLYIVNFLLMIHSQHQRFTVGVDGTVSHQKWSILMWLMWVITNRRHVQLRTHSDTF